MSDYKFDTFYYLKDKSNEHYLAEIETLDDNAYVETYKGKIYCPYCKVPQLSLVKKNGISFLRTYPNQMHSTVNGKMCPYTFDTASNSTMKRYIEELRARNRIQSMLEAVMRKLLMPKVPKDVFPQEDKEFEEPLLISRTQPNKTVTKNIIPHYSFKSWGKNIPQDRLLIVYGKVYIELHEVEKKKDKNDEGKVTYIHFKDKETKKLITSCLKIDHIEIHDGEYYVTALGRCEARTDQNQKHTYYNLLINSPNEPSILFKPVPS